MAFQRRRKEGETSRQESGLRSVSGKLTRRCQQTAQQHSLAVMLKGVKQRCPEIQELRVSCQRHCMSRRHLARRGQASIWNRAAKVSSCRFVKELSSSLMMASVSGKQSSQMLEKLWKGSC